MRVAIVHYHLRPGGVTRIIEHAVSAIRMQGGQVAVVSGEAVPSGKEVPPPVCVETALQYGGDGDVSAPDLADRIESQVRSALGGEPDVWHVHNHSLGKSALVPQLVREWSDRGHRILLQIHDFAEDGRPQNYRRLLDALGGGNSRQMERVLYPLSSSTHYAVLNGRDHGFLAESGVPAPNLHLLPNPVALPVDPDAAPCPGEGAPLYIYPTRAIRRKNLGEFLLWSAMTESPARFGVTLAPENPAERPYYEAWVKLARELNLPVDFEIGRDRSFTEVLLSASALVTTSVAEGFGMAFLEPWLVGRPVVGRNLPEITHEFESAGIDLSSLYDRLDVPLAWVGAEALRARLEEALAEAMEAYGRVMTADHVDRAWAAMVRDEGVDFGSLDEPLQAEVIRRVAASRDGRTALRPAELQGASTGVADTTESNRRAVLGGYNVEAYGRRLERIYESILDENEMVDGAADGQALLERFLAPERFQMLRT